MANSSATFSAVSGMECTPYRAFICGLIKRQPMVVSSICMLRLKALRFPHHKRRAGHALHAAGDHQLRFAAFNRPRRDADRIEAGTAQAVDGAPGTLSGSPASSSAIRATLRLSSPAWLAQPKSHRQCARDPVPGYAPAALSAAAPPGRRRASSPGTTKTAKGCTHRITDKCLIHHRFLTRFPPVVQRSAPPE
jgi:hypothetical protein